MTAISKTALALLLVSGNAFLATAFQPLPRTTVSPFSIGQPQSTLLSAFKTKDESKKADTSSIEQQEEKSMTFTPAMAEQESNGFDLSQEILQQSASSSVEKDDQDSPMEGLLWRGVVVVLCALWASNFPMAKLVMSEPGVDSSLYAVARFGVSALALAPGAIAATRRAGIDWETLKGAVVCGSWVAFGYLGQTLGLLSTTASKSCVICSMHCVFVAVVAELLRVNRAKENAATNFSATTQFDFKRLIPAAIAVAGVAVVELQGAAGGPNIGDLLSFAQPIGFGLGYLLLEDLMAKRPDAALAVSAIKLSVVALASLAMFELTPFIQNGGAEAFAFSIPDFSAILSSPVALGGILYTGLVTTALALWVESIAFARVPATDASLILTTEPLFAAALGAVTLGETFGMSDYAGASLIIGACVLATLMDDENRDPSCDPEDDTCEAPRSTPMGGL